MAKAEDHARSIFSAIVPDRKDLLEIAMTQLSADHFPDGTWRNFYVIFSWYHSIAGDVLTKDAVIDAIKKKSPDDSNRRVLYETVYESLEETKSSESNFRWALEQLKESYIESQTKSALTGAMGVLTSGITTPKGEVLRGHEAARDLILSRFAEIDRRAHSQESPEGDARDEEDDILSDYAAKKAAVESGLPLGLEFGIPEVDKFTGGLQKGELDFILGYASSGKTSWCVQLGWWTAFMQSKNIVYITTETTRSQVRRRMIARHSRLSKFELPEGLNSNDLKRGTLSSEMEEKLREVVYDFSHGENYGKCRIMQASEGMTVSAMKMRLNRMLRDFPIDLVIMDSLYVLKPEVRNNDQRTSLNMVIEGAYEFVTTFDNGEGATLVTPWQTRREDRDRAQRDGRYSMTAMAETAYAERYADLILSVVEPAQVQRNSVLSCAWIKNRDGEQSPSFDVNVDYANSYFTDTAKIAAPTDFNSLLGI